MESITCTKCKKSYSRKDFGAAKCWCKKCRSKSSSDWRRRNREKVNKKAREHYAKQDIPSCKKYRIKLKLAVITAYGGKCACCGEGNIEFLCIDHIDGGGSKHRREIGVANTYSWLKKNGYPEGFRVLCWNCNSSLGLYGYSPLNSGFK